MGKKIIRLLAAVLAAFQLMGAQVFAAAGPIIVEAEISEDCATAYIKNAGTFDTAEAMLGRDPVEVIRAKAISEAAVPVKTVILIDNSLSIPSEGRSAVRQQLANLIAARKEGEVYAVGTISDQVKILQGFTDDYLLLKRTLDNLPHHDQVTYITDALYDYFLKEPLAAHPDSFFRIILASDGVDNKSIGYTKEELLGLLKVTPVPIYTIGIPNGKAGNNEELENMFAISRATGASACLLSDLTSGGISLPAVMDTDRSNLVCTVQLPENVKDGSLKTLSVSLHEGETVRTVSFDQLRMPLLEKVPEPEPEPEPEPIPEPVPAPEPEPEPSRLPLILGIVGALVIAAAAFLLLKKRGGGFRTISPEEEMNRRMDERLEREGTVLLADRREEENGTMPVWNSEQFRRVTLTDTSQPDRCFQKPITQSLIVGLSRDSDICVNYDKSVSRKHCEILREGDRFFVVNHSQSNGTMVNGIKISEKTELKTGDLLKMGRVEMRVELNR